MKRFYLLAAVIVLIGFAFYGCAGVAGVATGGAGGGSLAMVATTSGAAARSVNVKAVSKAAGDFNDPLYMHSNPWYKDKMQIPSAYKVGLVEFKFLTQDNYNDTSGYTVDFGNVNGSAPSVTNPIEIDLTTGSYNLLSGGSLPYANTYTHCGTTLVYLELWLTGCFSATDSTSRSTGKFRVYASTSGNIQAGDVLYYSNDTWNWINPVTGALTPYTSSRPGGTASGWTYPFDPITQQVNGTPTPVASVVQDSFWSLRPTNSLPAWMAGEAANNAANGYVFKDAMQLGSPIIIEDNKSYTGTLNFNIATTVDAYFTGGNAPTGETGTFFWDDVVNDGTYAPFLPFALGGDSGGDGVHGQGFFIPLPPTITITMTST